MSYIKFGKYEPRREIVVIDRKNGNSMQHIYEFPNRYGVIVVQNKYSKGNEDGLYQLSVLKNGVFCHSTPLASDTVGYLTADDVAEHLQRIKKLPKEGKQA